MAAFDIGDVPEPTFLPALDRAPVRSGMRGSWLAAAAVLAIAAAAAAWWLLRG